jgi:nudix-type nucleoside diphosphatase (YffH/AdpP family)
MKFKVDIISEEILSKFWSTLTKVTLNYTRSDGRSERLVREVNDHGMAAAVLAVDPARRTVLLVKQMRIAAYMVGYAQAMVEVCAGLLDGDDPLGCVAREAEEELGYRLHDVTPVCDAFMSPGSLTERVALFTATYAPSDRLHNGGGVHGEGEDIEVIEIGFNAAYAMIASGEIVDAKTIILLQHAKIMGL